MAAETLWQKENNWNFLKDFSDKLKDLFKSVSDKFKEIFGITSKTKTELADLQKDILWNINIDNQTLDNKELSDDEKKIIENISNKYPDFKLYYQWINENLSDDVEDDKKLKASEFESILTVVKTETKDDNKLDTSEVENVVKVCKAKYDMCKKIEDKVKNDDKLKDKNITNSQILKAYNKILADNNWDASKITEDTIINNLKGEQPES